MRSNATTGVLNAAEEFAESESPWALLFWWLEWVSLLCLSRYARHRAQNGSTEWAKWALLPIFELVIVFKKIGLIGTFLSLIFMPQFFLDLNYGGWVEQQKTHEAQVPPNCESYSFAFFSFIFFFEFYTWTYFTVVAYFCCKSGGTTTICTVVAATLVLCSFESIVTFGECLGNQIRTAQLQCEFTNIAWGPTFISTSLPKWLGATDEVAWHFYYMSAWKLLGMGTFGLLALTLSLIG